MSNQNSREILCITPEFRVLAENVAQDLLLSKSKKYYEAAYEKFVEWKKNKAITSENCLLVYFTEMCKKFKPGFSSLFSNLEKIFTSLCSFLSRALDPSFPADCPGTWIQLFITWFITIGKWLIAESFRLAKLSAYERSNLTCELNPKLTWTVRNLASLVPFPIVIY